MSIEDKPFQEPEKVTLVDGSEIVLPRLTIGKIMAVTEAMSNLIKKAKEQAPQVVDIFSGKQQGESVGSQLVQVLPEVLPIVMVEVVNVLSIYLNMDKERIKNDMDMEDLVAIATPFFANITKQANHLLGPLSQMMGQKGTTDPSQ